MWIEYGGMAKRICCVKMDIEFINIASMFKPEITVATILERNGRFLLVEEETEQGILLNQPAGHLEADESIQDAAVRETLEETACRIVPDALVGIYLLQYTVAGNRKVSFLRFAFSGRIVSECDQPLDPDILRTVWMTYEEIVASRHRHRSKLVLQSIEDYLKGQRISLSVLSTLFVERN